MSRDKSAGTRPAARERGLALLCVLGFVLVFLVLVGALTTQVAMESNSMRISVISNQALSAADAGVHAMVEQIQTALADNTAIKTPITYSYPEPGASPSLVSYSASVSTPPIVANGKSYYIITSTGTYNTGGTFTLTRTVRAIAEAQPTSWYASSSQYETNQFGATVWYVSTQHFNGPVYSAGPMRIAYATPQPSPAPTVDPIFGSTVQTAIDPVWNPGDPNVTGDWLSVIAGGQKAFAIDNTPIGLPQPTQNIYVASEAFEGDGNNAKLPAGLTPGVYIDGSTSGGLDAAHTTQGTDTTGIYIETGTNSGYNGSATIVSSVSGNTETMVITSPKWVGAYTVTINYSNNFGSTGDCSGTTTVTYGSATHTFSGTPCGAPGAGVTNTGNGAIFADGNVQLGCTASAKACGTAPTPDTTLEGSFAIVTPDFSSWPAKANQITILGNVSYDKASQNHDELGLWANDVVLKTNSTLGITIDASIIAGYPGEGSGDGDFNNANCTKFSCGSRDQGTLTIFGGLIENIHGAVGEVYAGSNPCSPALQCGFTRVINYDPRLANSPPPFNPTTGNLQIIAWEDLGT
jgi:hypothetical protein